ncbi:MAG: neutral/alkaline non-lysosomal ceramidase N-terminal domain-containing protein [Paenibacillaceae bacterium]
MNLYSLKLGTSKVDITPEEPLPLAGFGHRKGHYSGIHHRLYLRIFFFQQLDCEGRDVHALLVQADLIWWGTDRIVNLLQTIKERWNVPESRVILHATHTHCGPQTSNALLPSLGAADEHYLGQLETKLFQGIDEAYENLEPVLLEKATGECQIGVNRRKQIKGQLIMAPNFEGPGDPEVQVIRFRHENTHELKGILFHYACHPTTTADNWISSEFPGVAMEIIEKETGAKVASFLQGCSGDLRPALIKNGEFYRGDDGDIRRFGKMLADVILDVLEGEMESMQPCCIKGISRDIRLPLQDIPTQESLYTKREEGGIVGEWSTFLLEDSTRLRPNIGFQMNLLHLAKGLSFLSMNGEVVVEYGLFIKQKYGGQVLPLPYSNGMIGYIPTAKQIDEGGYESNESTMYFGLPASFDKKIEGLIHNTIISLMQEEQKT